MAAYLYTWNPNQWTWADQAEAIVRINSGESYEIYWSCGRRRSIESGDTFFLMRLGVEPKGIIGFGHVSSSPFLLPHWDPERAKAGISALRTDLCFKALAESPILSLAELNNLFPDQTWTPQASGASISNEISSDLLTRLSPLVGNDSSGTPDVPSGQSYREGRVTTLTINTYDRSSQAREDCKNHYGYKCHACGFDFADTYGEIGLNYVEVHHLNQLADAGGEHLVNPIADLRPVCANCHRMLHKERPPLPIATLIERIKAQRSKKEAKTSF
jgi:5-methylcytosine-specific restriction protein A